MANIKRIHAHQLKIGMYIADINNEWVPDNNLRRHGLIKRAEAIQQINTLGVTELYIDVDKGVDCAEGVPIDVVNKQITNQLKTIQNSAVDNKPTININEEADSASRIHVTALNNISQIMNDVKMGNRIELQPIEDVADSIADSIRRNQSALACLTRLRIKDQYLIEHSFSVAVLMGILARAMGFSGDDLHQMVTGGLLHDIGKIRIPDNIIYKPGALTPDEWAEMKRHVVYGEEALDQPQVPKIIKQICGQHHERLDGTGYPRGLSAAAISVHGKMAAVVDVYDAITADRCYHQGIPPTTAMKKILEWSTTHLDKQIVYQFIACMSIYPAGAFVELDSGKLAVVIEPNLRKQHLPLVKVVWDLKNNKKVHTHLLNLAFSDTTERIRRAIDSNDFSLDFNALLVD